MKKNLIIFYFILYSSCILKSQTAIPFGISKDSIYPSFISAGGSNTETTGKETFFYYKPITYDALTSPVLFAIHGEGGDGLGPINDLIAIAERRKALIIGISFYYSGCGNLHGSNYVFVDSLDFCVDEGPATKIISPIYKHFLQREARSNVPVFMIGFSAGGQFVSRYMLIRQAYPDSVPLKMAVSSNPYYYTFPTDTFNGVPMPWLSGLIFSDWVTQRISAGYCPKIAEYYTYKCPDHIKQYYSENYGVLIGTGDTTPLSDNASAMAQGNNRYERAQTFYNFGLTDAPNYGTALNWKYREVIGVGHDQYNMYNSKNLTTDTFTIAERLLFDTPYNSTTQYAPVASFIADGISTTLPNATVNFTNNSFGATAYEWDFGDGNTSTAVNPVHTYTNASVSTTIYTNGTYTVAGQYFKVQLKATSANGCSNWDVKSHYIRVLPDMTTSTVELDLNNSGLQMMPNPASNEVIIKMLNYKESLDLHIEIYNYAGQLIQKILETSETIKLDTKNFSCGIYIIKIKCNDRIITEKLIVQH